MASAYRTSECAAWGKSGRLHKLTWFDVFRDPSLTTSIAEWDEELEGNLELWGIFPTDVSLESCTLYSVTCRHSHAHLDAQRSHANTKGWHYTLPRKSVNIPDRNRGRRDSRAASHWVLALHRLALPFANTITSVQKPLGVYFVEEQGKMTRALLV